MPALLYVTRNSVATEALMVSLLQAGLLLTATGVFLTTNPPTTTPPLINYTAYGPSICLWLSFAIALGGLIVTSGLRILIMSCEAKWFCDVCAYPIIIHTTLNMIIDRHQHKTAPLLYNIFDSIPIPCSGFINYCLRDGLVSTLLNSPFLLMLLIISSYCGFLVVGECTHQDWFHSVIISSLDVGPWPFVPVGYAGPPPLPLA